MTAAEINPDEPIEFWPRFFSGPAAAETSRVDRQAAALKALGPELEAEP